MSSVCVDGVKYDPGMIVSTGSCSGLPEFVQIEKIVAANTEILFVCKKTTAWYCEHLRSYQLIYSQLPCVVKVSELNDVFPLSVTSICSGYLKLQILTFSQQISCKECGGPGGVQIARKTKCVETHLK